MTLLLFALQVAAAPVDDRPIIVSATPLATTERVLRDCVARRCPADEDSNAATAHAENQFVAGDYAAARRTLGDAIARQGGEARRFPVAVADLWRANGRIASHLGLGNSYRTSAIAAGSALRAGLGTDDARYVAQRLEFGDAVARLGEIDRARDTYRWGARRATELGNPRLLVFALFRLGMIETAMGPSYRPAALRTTAQLLAINDPSATVYRQAGQLLQARLLMAEDGGAAFEALLANMRAGRDERPVRVDTPPPAAASEAPRVTLANPVSFMDREEVVRDQWVDIGFWIRPDGTVADIDTMRTSGTIAKSRELRRLWVEPLVRSVAARRYLPLAGPRDGPGQFRLERHTRVFLASYDYRSHTKSKGAIQTVVMDLTNDPAPGPAG